MKTFSHAAALSLAVLAPAGGAGAATIFGPTPYTSVADVPADFYASGAPDVLENFDEYVLQPDGSYLLDLAAGVAIDGIGNVGFTLARPPFGRPFDPTVDSVGTGGGFGGGAIRVSPRENRSITRVGFGFIAATPADLPTAVGIVWTDGLPQPPGGPAETYTFAFFGPLNPFAIDLPVAEITLTLGDDTFFGENPDGTRNTAEDRFVGVTHAAGIRGFTVTSGPAAVWELDELQWGRMAEPPSVIPLPAGLPLLAGALGLVALLRRRA
jgi:hypothetical protein